MVVDTESKVTIARGLVVGVFAWIAGYLLTYGLAIGDLRADEQYDALEAATGDSLGLEMIGLLFYNAHNVPADVPQYSVLQALEPSHNFVVADGGSTLLLYAVPLLVLLLAGALVSMVVQIDHESVTDAALTGTVVVVGYFPLVVLGTVVFTVNPGEGAMAPDRLLAIGLAGTLYPILVGALGGAVAHLATRLFRTRSLAKPSGS